MHGKAFRARRTFRHAAQPHLAASEFVLIPRFPAESPNQSQRRRASDTAPLAFLQDSWQDDRLEHFKRYVSCKHITDNFCLELPCASGCSTHVSALSFTPAALRCLCDDIAAGHPVNRWLGAKRGRD